uniref:Retrotransposon gag domain-containing protein n=1 Tax=Manihot esculenta TaxID=3983 RepID=A0A2C9VW83_MANES
MTNPTDLTKQPDDSSSSPQTPSGSINVNPTLTNQLISINASAQAPIKLTPFNYQIWYTQWYSLLIGYDFLNFIEQDRKTEATGNSFLFRQDQFIRSALIASLSPEVAPFVVGDKTSYDVWQSLSKMYAKPSQSRIMSLREQLLTITKGSLTISEYLQKAKSISFQLETAGVSVSAAEFALSVFLGLPSDYKEITAALRARDNVVSFDELHEKLTDVETQLNRDSNVITNQEAQEITTVVLGSNLRIKIRTTLVQLAIEVVLFANFVKNLDIQLNSVGN